ncbi:MAG: N-formylglutamate amidohydrolase [Planctomycetales bacterium]|nr:N-formylglutamate amidohydrolase [Planctomycetales bacterium]
MRVAPITDDPWRILAGRGPLVSAAVHDGHAARPAVLREFHLDSQQRLREEDPCTARWATVAPTQVVGCRSRFEFDLNRPREKAVYLTPDDAWGLQVWKETLPQETFAESLSLYDRFYEEVGTLFDRLLVENRRLVVCDIHSYNHRRGGPQAAPDDPALNPEVNLGTGTMDRSRWTPVVDAFLGTMACGEWQGRTLDVRENVKFRGGHFADWLHRRYPESVCVLSIEFKKIYMDEWTGDVDEHAVEALGAALNAAAASAVNALELL